MGVSSRHISGYIGCALCWSRHKAGESTDTDTGHRAGPKQRRSRGVQLRIWLSCECDAPVPADMALGLAHGKYSLCRHTDWACSEVHSMCSQLASQRKREAKLARSLPEELTQCPRFVGAGESTSHKLVKYFSSLASLP